VDMIVQNEGHGGMADISFTIPRGDLKNAFAIASRVAAEVGSESVEQDDKIAKVSIIGVGMQYSPGIASKMFEVLAENGINILMISTSEIKISCVIERKFTELAVKVLHEAFDLGKE